MRLKKPGLAIGKRQNWPVTPLVLALPSEGSTLRGLGKCKEGGGLQVFHAHGFFRAQAQRWALVAVLGAAAMGVAHSQNAGPSPRIYNCVDAKGRTLSSDRPLKECLDREQRILGGATVYQTGVLPPNYTDDERAAMRAQQQALEAKKKTESEARQRLRLLQLRYPNRRAFDNDRSAATAQIEAVISTAQAGLVRLQMVKIGYEHEAEFYQGGRQLPPSLLARMNANEREIADQNTFIAQQTQEKLRIQARYDADLPVLEAIWSGQSPD